MKIKCWFHGCKKKSPKMHWLSWFLTGLLGWDWRFWVCKAHRKVDFEEAREELRKHGKLS
jgi:hypothetical protein